MRSVAIVDDDEAVRESLSILLNSNGYEVICFATADEFLSDVAAENSDCILLDLDLPVTSGWQVLSALSAVRCQAIILITGRLTERTAARAQASGVKLVLEKPIPKERLLAQISEIPARG